jgi:hypothetical protein
MPRGTSSDTMPIRRIVSIAAPNLVPLGGIFFFGWSAPNLLILYALDTILSIGSMGALGGIYGRAPEDGSAPTALRGRLGWASGLAFMFAIAVPLAVPFGGWMFLLLAPLGWDVKASFADPAFVRGVLIQVALALVAYAHGYRALAGRGDADRLLKRRMAFILTRYTITVLAGIAGLELFGVLPHALGGQLQGFLLVGVYLGSSTFFELSPGVLSALDRGAAGSSEHAATVSRGSFVSYATASVNPAVRPIFLVIVGFVVGALLVASGARLLWAELGLSARGVAGSGGLVSRLLVPIAFLAVGLWILYRAVHLARRRRPRPGLGQRDAPSLRR